MGKKKAEREEKNAKGKWFDADRRSLKSQKVVHRLPHIRIDVYSEYSGFREGRRANDGKNGKKNELGKDEKWKTTFHSSHATSLRFIKVEAVFYRKKSFSSPPLFPATTIIVLSSSSDKSLDW